MAVAVGGARKRTSEQAWRSLLSGLEVISIADICGHISGYYGPLKINGGAHTQTHAHSHGTHVVALQSADRASGKWETVVMGS